MNTCNTTVPNSHNTEDNSVKMSPLEQLQALAIAAFKTHSQKINPGDVFVCRQGLTWDSHRSATDAVKQGAIAVIANRHLDLNVPCIVTSSHASSINLINQYFNYPQDRIKHIGVTGTNGKTTVSYCLQRLLNQDSDSAYTGTLGSYFGEHFYPLDNTTPDAITLLTLFNAMQKQKITSHVMEVSSHALSQDRVSIIDFEAVLITNIGTDHLDYHKSREDYIQTKLRLIDRLKPYGAAVINLDDALAPTMIERCRSRANVITFSLKNPNADLYASHLKASCEGSEYTVTFKKQDYAVKTNLPFMFNIENTMAMLAMMVALDVPVESAVSRLTKLQPAPGRSEVYRLPNQAMAIIDYAHNYDSLSNLFNNVRSQSFGKVYTVLGVTGDRLSDAAAIGNLCSKHSEHVFFTTDNPLGFCQTSIFSELTSQVSGKNATVIEDRGLCIKAAVSYLKKGDVLLLCGKGDEKHQYVSGNKNEYVQYIGDYAALMLATKQDVESAVEQRL
ncbi:Mur ligase family protein [Photobacterium minamisatsumaniensis]|uniref:Mur ligase family protein n=1 Tax=Photobacterium minamisatsumaniensis TaxID=2910233 RepID=UPI003D0BC856